MPPHDRLKLARYAYGASETGDRRAIEELLGRAERGLAQEAERAYQRSVADWKVAKKARAGHPDAYFQDRGAGKQRGNASVHPLRHDALTRNFVRRVDFVAARSTHATRVEIPDEEEASR